MSSLSIQPSIELAIDSKILNKYWHLSPPNDLSRYDLQKNASKPTLNDKSISALEFLQSLSGYLKNDHVETFSGTTKIAVEEIHAGYRARYCEGMKFFADYLGWTISLFYETDLMKVNRLASEILTKTTPPLSLSQKITKLFQSLCPCLKKEPPSIVDSQEEKIAFDFKPVPLADEKSSRCCQCFWEALERLKKAFKPKEARYYD